MDCVAAFHHFGIAMISAVECSVPPLRLVASSSCPDTTVPRSDRRAWWPPSGRCGPPVRVGVVDHDQELQGLIDRGDLQLA